MVVRPVPIMPVMKVKDEAEAIRLTNDCDYGLSASVWSKDHKRAQRVAHELEVGSVNVNDNIVHYAVPMLPFGGRKKSGLARTHGKRRPIGQCHAKGGAGHLGGGQDVGQLGLEIGA